MFLSPSSPHQSTFQNSMVRSIRACQCRRSSPIVTIVVVDVIGRLLIGTCWLIYSIGLKCNFQLVVAIATDPFHSIAFHPSIHLNMYRSFIGTSRSNVVIACFCSFFFLVCLPNVTLAPMAISNVANKYKQTI